MTSAICTLAIALVVPLEELRFAGVFEQEHADSCAAAAIASLVGPFWGIDSVSDDDDDFRGYVSVAEVAASLRSLGFAVGAFRMTPGELQTNVNGYGPTIVHFDRPTGHFAVCVTALPGSFLFVIADPARGVLTWDSRQLARHFSGVAVIPVHREVGLNRDAFHRVAAPPLERRRALEDTIRRVDVHRLRGAPLE